MSEPKPFLQALPAGLSYEQRVALDGLGVAINLIQDAYNILWHDISALTASGTCDNIELSQRVRLISAAWTIVDRLDIIRQLLHFQRDHLRLEMKNSYKDLLESSRIVRNAMDHPIGTIKTRVAKKSGWTIFGYLGWSWHHHDDISTVGENVIIKARRCSIVSISSEHDRYSLNFGNLIDGDVGWPWGNLTLFAFGKEILLDDALDFANYLQAYFNDHFAEVAKQALEAAGASQEPVTGAACISVRAEPEEPWQFPVAALPSNGRVILVKADDSAMVKD